MIQSCKTHCGQKINYESVEFSDGFVYELPKNNDGTVVMLASKIVLKALS